MIGDELNLFHNLNYQHTGTLDIFIRYTTEYLKDYTTWFDATSTIGDDRFDVGWETDFD